MLVLPQVFFDLPRLYFTGQTNDEEANFDRWCLQYDRALARIREVEKADRLEEARDKLLYILSDYYKQSNAGDHRSFWCDVDVPGLSKRLN